MGRRRAHRLRAAHDEMLLLLGPILLGVASAILAARSPAVATALALAGLQ
jgi:hypothetical protein